MNGMRRSERAVSVSGECELSWFVVNGVII